MSGSQLPRGPHDLSRDEVAASQRRRLLDSLAAEVAGKGYSGTTVKDVAAGAGVSLATFYEQFGNKDEAFLAGLDDVAGRMNSRIQEKALGTADPLAAIDTSLAGIVDFWRENPEEAVAYLVEVRAAGPKALDRRAELNEGFSQAIQALVMVRANEVDVDVADIDPATLAIAADALTSLTAEFTSEAVRKGDDLDETLEALRVCGRLLLGLPL